MTTITLWLLVTVGSTNTQALVMERFATHQDCEKVRVQLIAPHGFFDSSLPRISKCIEAKVVR